VRILLVTGDLPWPGTSGGRLRDQLLYHAAAAAGEVHLLSFPFRGASGTGHLPPNSHNHPLPWDTSLGARLGTRARATWHGRLVFQQHLVQYGAVARLRDIVAEVDPLAVILASPLYEPFVQEVANAGRSVFVDMTDLRSGLVSQQLRQLRQPARWARSLMDALAVRRAEAGVVGSAQEVWFARQADGDAFRRRYGSVVRVVPNTIDVAGYADLRAIRPRPRSFGFVGSFDYAPNVGAAEQLLQEVLPALRARSADASLILIGRSPPPTLVALARRVPGAILIADDPTPIRSLAQAGVLAAPLKVGVGTKFKLIEAAAAGVPIVTSPVGLDGLVYRAGAEVLVARTTEEFVRAIERIWSDSGFAATMAWEALAATERAYDNRVSDAAVRAALATTPRPAERGDRVTLSR
jgi:glycosyltransferase involved in cell wall biosynthesis